MLQNVRDHGKLPVWSYYAKQMTEKKKSVLGDDINQAKIWHLLIRHK